jgi:hypothetical protein
VDKFASWIRSSGENEASVIDDGLPQFHSTRRQCLEPGSCQAARISALLEKPVLRMTMTREKSERKHLAYELQRVVRRTRTLTRRSR